MKNERLHSLVILTKLLENKIPLSYLMQANKDLSPLAKEICFGVCRHYFRLQVLADRLVKKRPKDLEISLILLIGLYQLHYMQKPHYAVVKETVALLEPVKKTWAKGLINAVLRTFCREQTSLLSQIQGNEDFDYGHPHWFIKRLQKDWPVSWQNILQANDNHPPMNLRINQRKALRTQYLQRLEQKGMKASLNRYSLDGLQLEQACDVADLPGFEEGELSIQDESAQIAVSLLSLQPKLRVLDACCAPGGKTGHILEAEPGLAECLALDVDEKRLARVAQNLARLGLKATLVQGDGLKPEIWWDGRLFDRILLDAPCSATGVIRRHPDIKILRSEEEVGKISAVQLGLLKSLWPLLAPDGILVYATCSILRQENEEQIFSFIKQQSDCSFLAENKAWGHSTGHGWQILPGDFNSDGFFYSVLKKCP